MGKTIDLFLDADIDLATLVRDLESLYASKATLAGSNGETWYQFDNSKVAFTVGEHDLINDQGMHFEDYRYQVQMWPLSKSEEGYERLNAFAQQMYKRLKAKHKYALLLTDDVQAKLAEYHPSHASKQFSLPKARQTG